MTAKVSWLTTEIERRTSFGRGTTVVQLPIGPTVATQVSGEEVTTVVQSDPTRQTTSNEDIAIKLSFKIPIRKVNLTNATGSGCPPP